MRAALAVLLPLIVVCNAVKRCATRENVGGPADRRVSIYDAVVLLEAARSSLCEADLTVLNVGLCFGTEAFSRIPRPSGDRPTDNRASCEPIRHGPNAAVFTSAFRLLERRLIKDLLFKKEVIVGVYRWADRILNDAERQAVAPPRRARPVSPGSTDQLASAVRALRTDHVLRFGRDLLTRNDFAIRDANFVDLPVQRFWNVARVPVDDLMNAISETANQISASRLMLHQLIADRLILYDVYTRVLDLASSVCSLAEDAIATNTDRTSPTTGPVMVSRLRLLIGRVRLLVDQIEYMGVLYKDALERLEQAHKYIQQSLEACCGSLLCEEVLGASAETSTPAPMQYAASTSTGIEPLSAEACGSVVTHTGNSPLLPFDQGTDATVRPEVVDIIVQAVMNPSPALRGLLAGMPQSATIAKELLACVVCTGDRRTTMETSPTVTIKDDRC
ncbi:Secreted protein [Plasmodiophora brassicae]